MRRVFLPHPKKRTPFPLQKVLPAPTPEYAPEIPLCSENSPIFAKIRFAKGFQVEKSNKRNHRQTIVDGASVEGSFGRIDYQKILSC